MKRYRILSIFGGFKVLKEAVIDSFRWLFDMKKISVSKILFLQPRYKKYVERA